MKEEEILLELSSITNKLTEIRHKIFYDNQYEAKNIGVIRQLKLELLKWNMALEYS